MHLGLIGGIGPAATEYYYRGLIRRQDALSRPLELTIAHADMSLLIANLGDAEADAQAQVFRRHLSQLEKAGAELAAITSIAGHFCIDELEAISPVPLVSALTALKEALAARGHQRIGLLGSSAAMTTKLYGRLNGFDVVLPPGADLGAVNDTYFAMAAARQATTAQRRTFFEVGKRLCADRGAEVVVLVGTDLFLAFEGHSPGFPIIDSADVHIAALTRVLDTD